MYTKNKKYSNKKILFTFGEKGLRFINTSNQNFKSFNIKNPNNDEITDISRFYEIDTTIKNDWWHGINTFYEQEKAVISAIRNKQEIVIIAEKLYGFQAGFLCNLLNIANVKNKKITLITAVNAMNDNYFLEYLSDKTEIINVLETEKYKDSLKANISVYGLETCMNSVYIEKIQECFEIPAKTKYKRVNCCRCQERSYSAIQ